MIKDHRTGCEVWSWAQRSASITQSRVSILTLLLGVSAIKNLCFYSKFQPRKKSSGTAADVILAGGWWHPTGDGFRSGCGCNAQSPVPLTPQGRSSRTQELLAQSGAAFLQQQCQWDGTCPLVGHYPLPTQPKDNTSTFILLCTTFFTAFRILHSPLPLRSCRAAWLCQGWVWVMVCSCKPPPKGKVP